MRNSLPLNLLELLNECSVKLIYLGQLRFGELKPKKPSRIMPSLPVQASVHPSTSRPTDTNVSLPVQPHIQPSTSKPMDIDASTSSTSASTISAATVSLTGQTPSLPVATSSPHVGTVSNKSSVETNMDSGVNVGTDNGQVHVETQDNNQGALHVETTADQPVTLHVHVEMPDKVSPNAESV